MSITLYLYSPSRVLAKRKAVRDALGKKGWFTLLLDPDLKGLRKDGPVDSEVVFGARDESLLNRALKLTISGRFKQLRKLFKKEEIGCCGIDAVAPLKGRNSALEKVMPADVLKARSLYCIETNPNCSKTSAEIQATVWDVLGDLMGGLLSNPHREEYIRVGPKGRKVLTFAEPSEGSPLKQYRKYFAALKAAGFPVEKKSEQNWDPHPEKLSPKDLERLLAFTRKYFAPDETHGRVMNELDLESYKKRKGKAFLKENALWLSQIELKFATPCGVPLVKDPL